MRTITVCHEEDGEKYSAIYVDGEYRGIYKDFDELPCCSTLELLEELGVKVEYEEVDKLPDDLP